MSKSRHSATPSELRIIAGKYRGRKIAFRDATGLRPTGDRLRETLFSWLQTLLPGARCLDLFAGSGALGIEAASRGAQEVLMIEFNAETFRMLQHAVQQLDAKEIELKRGDALSELQAMGAGFDVIFLDPPFHGEWLTKILPVIAERGLLKVDGLAYLEFERERDWPALPANWQWYRQKEAGQVRYGLARRES